MSVEDPRRDLADDDPLAEGLRDEPDDAAEAREDDEESEDGRAG